MKCVLATVFKLYLNLFTRKTARRNPAQRAGAATWGASPARFNYVLTSRFTPEQGYIVESRRGGGGYIRITRMRLSKSI